MGCTGSSHARNPKLEGGGPIAVEVVKADKAQQQQNATEGGDASDKGATDGIKTEESLPSTTAPAAGSPLGREPSTLDGASPASATPTKGVANLKFLQQRVNDNGFRVIEEKPPLVISESSLAPYSLPAEVLTYEPPEDVVTTRFNNGDKERKIHCNTRLSPEELENLDAMRDEAQAQGADFYPSVTSMATRFLSRARGDPKKAVKLMQETQDWRQAYFTPGPCREAEVQEDIKHGMCYFCGRDSNLRPAIIIRLARIPVKWDKEGGIARFIRILIFSMEYFLRYMVVPGRIENLNVIVDLAGMGISQIPISAVSEVYKVMSHHYIGRVYKFYVCNVSRLMSTMAGLVISLLTDRQKQKMNVLDDNAEMLKEFAAHQLEQDLGGTRPKLVQFFPFPMSPGPYGAGYRGEPDTSTVADVHNIMGMGGSLGRLWNPKETDENNSKLDYGPKAADILQRCNLPVPPELLEVMQDGEQSPKDTMSTGIFPYDEQDGESGTNTEPQGSPQGSADVIIHQKPATQFPPPIGNLVDSSCVADESLQQSDPLIESARVGGCIFCCRL